MPFHEVKHSNWAQLDNLHVHVNCVMSALLLSSVWVKVVAVQVLWNDARMTLGISHAFSLLYMQLSFRVFKVFSILVNVNRSF